jgi:hypothetical protein
MVLHQNTLGPLGVKMLGDLKVGTYLKRLKSQFLLEEIHLQREVNKTPC